MENILFRNVHKRDEELYKEICSYILFGSPVKSLAHLVMIVSSIVLVILCVQMGSMWEYLLFPVAGFYSEYFSYRRALDISVRKEYEASARKGELNEYVLSVCDEYVDFISESGSHITIDFADIKEAAFTKNTVLLITHAKTWFVFPKDKFTVGSADGFIEFLKTKKIRFANGRKMK